MTHVHFIIILAMGSLVICSGLVIAVIHFKRKMKQLADRLNQFERERDRLNQQWYSRVSMNELKMNVGYSELETQLLDEKTKIAELTLQLNLFERMLNAQKDVLKYHNEEAKKLAS